MKKPKGLLIAGMSFVLIFSGAGLLAAPQNRPKMGRHGGGPGKGQRMELGRMFGLQQIVRCIDLTDDQRAQIREILEENRNQIEQVRRNVIEARENLDAGFPETAEALGDAHTEAALLRAQIFEQVKQLLTVEQLDLLELGQQLRKVRFEDSPSRFGRGVEP